MRRQKPADMRELKSIAMLGSFPPLRGLSSYCIEIARSLADLVEVEFISFKRMYPKWLYPGGDLSDDLTFPEIRHPGLRVRRRLTWYNPLSWMREGSLTHADLLHAQWWSLPLAGVYVFICLLFKLRGKPIVITVHNVRCHDGSRLYRMASHAIFKLGDHFIVHTRVNRDQLMSEYGIAHRLISVVPHGALTFQVPDQFDRKRIRRELGLRPQDRMVLLFGAIRPYKGVDTALEALARVLPVQSTVKLVIAGKLWEPWRPYQRLIDELNIGGHVHTFLQYIPSEDVYRFFGAADLVLLPYRRFDSQSGVGATALGFDKPMVVTDVGGLPDLAWSRHHVVPPDDPDALAQAILGHFQAHEKTRTPSAAAVPAAATPGWPAIARQTKAVYDKAVRHHRRTSKGI